MTRRRKKRRKHTKRKTGGGSAGTAIYVRCRFCGREFVGNSRVLKEWSEHIGPCEKEHKERAEKK